MQVNFNKKAALLCALAALGIAIGILSFTSLQLPSCSTPILPHTHFAPDVVPGKIVTLKKLREEYFIDFHNMFSIKVRDLFESPKHITLNYTINILRYVMDLNDKGETLYYCVFDNKDNRLIGAIEVREKNDIDPGQLGCWINENYWGSGRIQEAYKLIAQTYFSVKPQETSFNAHVRTWNIRSYKAMKKFGFTDVGTVKASDGKADRHVLELHRGMRQLQ